MIQLPKLDNKWLTPSPTKGAGKSLSIEPSVKEKDSSPANVLSGTSEKNKSDLPSRNDFQSTLKNKLNAPASPAPKEDKMVDERESVMDDSEVVLSDSDAAAVSVEAPVVKAPMMMKAPALKAAKASDEAQPMEHRLAWNSFLHKMKDKLGISAQDILSAFKSLTQEELAQPPEQNIAKLVQQLGLNDQQAAMAHQFFKELIVRTDAQALNNNSARLGLDAGPLAATTQQELRQQKTEQSLQNMNDRFFMTATSGKASTAAPAMAQMSEKPMLDGMQKNNLAAIASGEKIEDSARASVAKDAGIAIPTDIMKASQQAGEMPNIENFSKVSMKQVADTKAPKIVEAFEDAEMPQMPTPATASPLMNIPKFNAKNLNAPDTNFDPNANSIPTLAQTPTNQIPVMPLAPTFGGAPEKNFDESTEDSGDMLMADGDETAIAAGHGFRIDTTDVQGNKELAKAMPTMAVPELVQQAQVMVKDGGGEMKVVLTPEGLGEVAMKVSVKDGKVNVEMITQSDDAKKMLESTMHSLRDGLSAHHLNLESIKVDSAPSLSTQLDQQYRDAQKQQAQQFLEQFHQNNRGQRQSYFDIPGAQTYRSQKDRTSLGPQNLSNPTAASRRLDLVA